MENPYEAPTSWNQGSFRPVDIDSPAIALIVVSTIAIVVGVLGLLGDIVLIASGAIETLEQNNEGPVSKYVTIAIRSFWGVGLLIAAGFVLYGSLQMRKRQNYSTARMACVVAMIPLLGPCCLLGIPFGIWGFFQLGQPGVKESFLS